MNTVEIINSNKGKIIYRADWPSRWDELTTAQFVRVAHELFENENEYEARAKVAYAFLNRPMLALKLTFGEAFELGDLVSFVFKENPMTRKSFFKRAGFLHWLKGPEDNFVNLSAWQFASAEMAFERITSNVKNTEALSHLAGCLLMPEIGRAHV